MSWNPALEPVCPDPGDLDRIGTVIVPRSRDIGGFEVRRALPSPKRQMVGPFKVAPQQDQPRALRPRATGRMAGFSFRPATPTHSSPLPE